MAKAKKTRTKKRSSATEQPPAKNTYSYKKGRITPALEAQIVGEELERIAAENNGAFTPPTIVDAARPEEAVLHPCFEWRDEVAAEQYRCHQARQITNVLIVHPAEAPHTSAPAFVSVPIVQEAGPPKREYHTIQREMSDPETRMALEQRVLERLVRTRREFAEVRAFSAIWRAIDDLAASMIES